MYVNIVPGCEVDDWSAVAWVETVVILVLHTTARLVTVR